MSDCVFCELIERGDKAPNDWIEAWEGVRAFAPLNPVVPGHVLVVPTKHVRDALEDPDTTARVFGCASVLAKGPCNLITSAGPEATQSVFHLHVHIVPRLAGDGLSLPWTRRLADTKEGTDK